MIVYCQCKASKLHQILIQSGFDHTRENKSEQLIVERRKLPCTQRNKRIVVAREK
jgi:hypothetical protein